MNVVHSQPKQFIGCFDRLLCKNNLNVVGIFGVIRKHKFTTTAAVLIPTSTTATRTDSTDRPLSFLDVGHGFHTTKKFGGYQIQFIVTPVRNEGTVDMQCLAQPCEAN